MKCPSNINTKGVHTYITLITLIPFETQKNVCSISGKTKLCAKLLPFPLPYLNNNLRRC
jgi:hypothetical protein